MDIDICVFGSSRPLLLFYTMKFFKKYMLTEQHKFRYILNEDFVFLEESQKVIKSSKELGFDLTFSRNPKIGLSYSMDHILKKVVKTPYIIYLQDDWEFERPVELDKIIYIMEKNKNINCVTFNKHKNIKGLGNKREVDYDGVKLCVSNMWPFLPGIWRMDTIYKNWSVRYNRPEGFFTNKFGTHEQRCDPDYSMKNMGSYYYGHLGDFRYVRHLGGTWRMASWQLEQNDGKPNGEVHWEFQNVENDRAPWLNKLEERPLNADIKLKPEWKEKLMKNYPEYLKKIYGDK